jgi:hypothetical protein
MEKASSLTSILSPWRGEAEARHAHLDSIVSERGGSPLLLTRGEGEGEEFNSTPNK